MSNADQRYQEKIRARREGRAPVVSTPVVVPAGAPAHERYLAKLAARAAGPSDAKPAEAKPEPPKGEDPKPEKPAKAKAEDPKPAEAKPEPPKGETSSKK